MREYVNDQLNDRERVEVAKLEYQELQLDQRITLSGGQYLGEVWQLSPVGFRAFAIADSLADPHEVTVLYRGSTMMPLDPDVWTSEWLDTNLPIGRALMSQHHHVPKQLVEASRWLSQLIKLAPRAKFYVYGHSLGSINAQYAIIMCHHPEQIANAWLYEGSNVYRLLDADERKQAVQFKGQIQQYIDPLDSLAIGYTDFSHVIGQLHYVDSLLKPRIIQHMWGGYRYDDHGSLRLRMPDDPLVQSCQNFTHDLLTSHPLQIPDDDSQTITNLRKLMAMAAELRESLIQ
ncbi:hypothetical protein [Limosilactobacillus sp.]|uniref:hypothetical protein n=1 Tax=Limosilactobacillus sp. TaxID=2773925 RepID=UPI00345E6835